METIFIGNRIVYTILAEKCVKHKLDHVKKGKVKEKGNKLCY